MYFGFTEEQHMLRNSVRRFLELRCPITEVRRLKATPEGYAADLWRAMAEAGWLGVTLPEAYGGLGLGWLELLVILEEMGRGLFPSPFLGNILAATAINEHGSEGVKQQYLPSLIDGSRKGTVALFEENATIAASSMMLNAREQGGTYLLNGVKRNVMDPQSADSFVVSFRYGDHSDDVAIALVDATAPGVTATAYPLIDETKRMGNLALENVNVSMDRVLLSGTGAVAAIERLVDQGALALTAEMAGTIDAALHITVQYARERMQFGHPIGHFQAVKHPLAEIYVDLESCRSLLYYGAHAHDQYRTECSRIASMAKAYATDTLIRAATDAIQIHGATGYMKAVDIHLYYLRSKWARPI